MKRFIIMKVDTEEFWADWEWVDDIQKAKRYTQEQAHEGVEFFFDFGIICVAGMLK
ncbi:MAG TPA: hypothetical protein VFD00_08380 [Thermoclostridium sp.]|nr:hypothetical protein [Thermoclostridium sp.]